MAEKCRQQSWSEYLDKGHENKLFIRFVFTADFHGIEEFAVVYLASVRGGMREVVRYNCSSDEAVHIHRFYRKPAEKAYLNREKCIGTLEEFADNIRENWRGYRSKFLGR